MRLDRFLAETGNGSRTDVKKLISAGSVSVNGIVCRDPSAKIREDADEIRIGAARVRYAKYEYYMLNKPQGVISAVRDGGRYAETCVTDLIREKIRKDLFPVGRLDRDTEGLLLITNDGDLAHRLLSPKKHVDKTYYTELDGPLDQAAAGRIMAGADIGDEKLTLPCEIRMLSDTSCLITIREGRYHQIKRMFLTEGRTVTYLKRLSMGPLSLDSGLAPGESRELKPEELDALKNLGLDPK